jgi:FAD/FMN-containing dehydrogenase
MTRHLETISRQVPERAVQALERQFAGEVIRPGDAAYDLARQVWNATVDRHPALIVRPRNAHDVILALHVARANDLPLAVRGGGHSVAGYGTVDRGLIIDLSHMKSLEIDPERRLAIAESGLTWGEFNAQTHDQGLATPGPDVAAVGLGGHTLGGGFGWLSRKYGMTIDTLIAAEVVTADGEVMTASEAENSELFWGLRGGGGNFGIATRFRFRLHPVSTIVGGVLVYPARREVLRAYVDTASAAPDELTTLTSLLQAPPLPFIPVEAHGAPVFMVIACHAGDLEASERAYAPFRNLGGHLPLADTVGSMPYPALFDLTQMAATRQPQAIRAGFMHDLDETAIDTILDAIAHPSSPYSKVMLRVLGGEIARVPPEATAFAHRDKRLYVAINNSWDDVRDPQADHHVAWTEALWQVLAPRTTGAYANFLGDEGAARVRAAYSPASLARLASLKRRYDPDNVFRLNANIAPT